MNNNQKPPQDNKPKSAPKAVKKAVVAKKIPNLETEIKELERMTKNLFGKSTS